jgi:putative endonuclease
MASKKEMTEPSDPRRRFGNRGEDLAAAFFIAKGFKIVKRNWSCRMGEIDLIAEKDGMTHFIEVKTRRTTTYGHPEEAITPIKLKHLSRAIEMYLRSARPSPMQYQADALAISIMDGVPPEFHYVEGIL